MDITKMSLYLISIQWSYLLLACKARHAECPVYNRRQPTDRHCVGILSSSLLLLSTTDWACSAVSGVSREASAAILVKVVMCFIFSRYIILVCHLASSTSCRLFTDADRQTSRGRVVYAFLVIASDQFTDGNRVQHVSFVRGVRIKVSNIRTCSPPPTDVCVVCTVIAALSTTSLPPLILKTILLSIAPNGSRDDVITCRWLRCLFLGILMAQKPDNFLSYLVYTISYYT